MTDKEKTIKELKEALDSLDITNKYRLNLIRAIEYLQEEPVSEELEEAVNAYIGYAPEIDESSSVYGKRLAFKAGAEWQKEQFEKNRIEHCEGITEEQYNLETEFIDLYIKRFNRLPTILDATEYGKTLGVQKR